MATTEQINANRENAKLSTGPTSPEGIARSSQNALKHGLLGRTVHLTLEEEEPYRLFHESLFHTLKPRGANEEYLVESLIDSRWRISQISQIEAGIYAMGFYENKKELANYPAAQASQIARALTFKQNQKEFEKQIATANGWIDKAMEAKKVLAEKKAKAANSNGITTEEK